jgi:hypothetical protein
VKWVGLTVALTLVVLAIGCSTGPSMKQLTEHQVGAEFKFEQIRIGMPEKEALAKFKALTWRDYKTGEVGWVDIDDYRAEGYHKKTYWVGRYYFDQYNSAFRVKRWWAVTVVNGVVESKYIP